MFPFLIPEKQKNKEKFQQEYAYIDIPMQNIPKEKDEPQEEKVERGVIIIDLF